MACPLVAGIAALILQASPDAKPKAVTEIMLKQLTPAC